MSSFCDEENIQRLFVAKDEVKPELLGRGPAAVRGSTYMQGPVQVGDDRKFPLGSIPTDIGTVMISETKNSDMIPIPFYSLFVQTYARIKSFLKVDRLFTVELIKSRIIYTDVLMARSKNFVIDHPLKENKKLVHACLEGPENGVYIRGRVTNKNEINLPDYWQKLIDKNTISIQLQPVGAHQNIIVKRWDEKKIYLQSQGGMPIDCFYHIYAERKDIEPLKTEID
jgi:hypothetical protein